MVVEGYAPGGAPIPLPYSVFPTVYVNTCYEALLIGISSHHAGYKDPGPLDAVPARVTCPVQEELSVMVP